MFIRTDYAVIFIALIAALFVCVIIARKSRKKIAPCVALFIAAIIPPIAGNLIVVSSTEKIFSTVGYYIFFVGMDLVMFAFTRFTLNYCDVKTRRKKIETIVNTVLLLDAIQFIFNPFFHQAFDVVESEVDGKPYFMFDAYFCQNIHRLIDYGVLFAMFGIFLYRIFTSYKINAEKYYVIVVTLLIVTVWETFYIISRTPIDRSMIGFGVFGLCTFYFSLYYRPFKLLDSMLAKVASETKEALFFFDSSDRCIWVNAPARKALKINANDYEDVGDMLEDYFGSLENEEPEWNRNITVGEGDDTKYYYLEKHIIKNDKGRVGGSFLSVRDNTEEMLKIKQNEFNATHDSLTQIYNKDYLFSKIREKIDENPDITHYILYVDVDDFKMVNEVFGNEFGDNVLRYLAMTIQNLSSPGTLYGRIVSDTFGICLVEDLFDEEMLIRNLTHFTVSDGDLEQNILLHMGVYKVEDRDIDVPTMFDRARMAVSTIKKEYHKYIAYYDSKMREEAVWSQRISTQLSDALKDGQIRPYLQPIVDNEGKVMGAEALVRWIHPTDGFMSPGSFIPVFEKNGMIADVDRHMWRTACEILAKWKRIGLDMFISINISPKDFYFMDVAGVIKELVREYGIEPRNLRIEITETVMITENEKHMEVLNDLRSSGFLIEMDDFGSGYSSLNMLKDMPIDLIKIDMAFLRETKDIEKARIILKNIITMSGELSLISLTEGVETEEQFNTLAEMGCKLFQGYHFSKPLPVNEFEKYIGL